MIRYVLTFSHPFKMGNEILDGDIIKEFLGEMRQT